MRESFKARIKILCLRQDFIAKQLGVTSAYLSMYLTGKREFDSSRLIQLDNILKKYE
jgi:predicted transcriptional regulator